MSSRTEASSRHLLWSFALTTAVAYSLARRRVAVQPRVEPHAKGPAAFRLPARFALRRGLTWSLGVTSHA